MLTGILGAIAISIIVIVGAALLGGLVNIFAGDIWGAKVGLAVGIIGGVFAALGAVASIVGGVIGGAMTR